MAPSHEVIELLDSDDDAPPKLALHLDRASSAVVQFETPIVDLSAEFDDSVFNEFNDDLTGGRDDLKPIPSILSLPEIPKAPRAANAAAYSKLTWPSAELSDNGLDDLIGLRPLKKRRLKSPATDGEDETAKGVKSSKVVHSKATKSYVFLPISIDYCQLWSDDPPLKNNKDSRESLDFQSIDITNSEFEDLDDVFGIQEDPVTSQLGLSGRTAALLEHISNASKSKPRRRKPMTETVKGSKTTPAKKNASRQETGTGIESASDGSPGKSQKSANTTAGSKMAQATSAERLPKQQERDQLKLQKAKEKEEEKERKRLEKEEKARQKQVAADIAEVNKVKIDKAYSTPEMIVDLPNSIRGRSLSTQILKFFQTLQIRSSFYESSVPNVVKWRRKAITAFNEELDHWERVPEKIARERHALCLMTANEFVSMVTADPSENELDLEVHVLRIKSGCTSCAPVYLIEGLNAFMRKNKNSKNRAHEEQVRQELSSQASGTAAKRKKKIDAVVDEDQVEDALLRLQVVHGCLIHHTEAAVETAEWVVNFTQHISTIPYKKQRQSLEASFCMDAGQIKTGEDAYDTYVKMLQEVVRVTPQIAHGIASEYPSVIELVRAMKMHGSLLLEDVKKCYNKNGRMTDAKVGPAISRRLYTIFTQLDPSVMDI